MRVYNFDKKTAPSGIVTELVFTIACARADGENLLRFNFLEGDTEREMKVAQKELKALKRRGAVQLFATFEDFEKADTEAEFLLNKFPTLEELDAENFILVKL